MNKNLVLYFSVYGAAKKTAGGIAKQTGQTSRKSNPLFTLTATGTIIMP
ncbi:MAG: hypothetical protein VB106_02290 [Clostridiaceae bacterium]|nr:hypothetical protein [Clostridiaceae bacterium]